ncbi:bromodomain-containing protein DDB_G0280777 isoform X2 [Tetranychus urticae]|uniref:Zinc finger PHD-type domain-containing protein n=1 Tax=Tetranychus urticae TaxID=32264 RepID=T1KGT6_TETUR|nr:bromodomain-containing protein DDB_G0280777 isoform X2 [Tetranychus urticae]
MPETDKYCWICHREHASLPCKECFRNYHYRCARNIMTDDSLFVPDPNNRRLYQFSTSCSECQMLAKAARNWDKGLEFQKISKKTLNTLLSYILDLLKQSAPAPLLWPASKLSISGCPFTMDFHKIKDKTSDNLYNSPREFLNDITLINHNCAVIVKCENRNREMRALSKELYIYKNEMIEFKKTAEARIRYLEDCPHCILNFSNFGDKWLTMTCPWGHLLILAKIDDSLWPAKLIRYNRSSGRLDVILFGTGERTRISESQCWIPCRSDLDIPQKKEELIEAYDQARKYVNTLRKKFGRKFSLPGLRRRIKDSDKDYISKGSSSDEDVILLTDDEQEEHGASVESGSKEDRSAINKQSLPNDTVNTEGATSKKDDSVKGVENNKNDNISDINNNSAKINAKDTEVRNAEPNQNPITESDNIKSNAPNNAPNIAPDIAHNKATNIAPDNAPNKVPNIVPNKAPNIAPDIAANNVPNHEPTLLNGTTDNILNDSPSMTEPKVPTEREKEVPIECSIEEPEVSSTQVLPEDHDTLKSDQCTQFEIVYDDESEGTKITSISNEVEEKIAPETDQKFIFSPVTADFVIEDETSSNDEPLKTKVTPIPESHFTLTLDDQSKETVFESTVMTDLSGSYLYHSAMDTSDHSTFRVNAKSLRDDYDDNLSGPLFKKMKYDSLMNFDYISESQKVKERLALAEKELLQLKMHEEYREAVTRAQIEALKAKSLEENCEKLQKELTETADKLKEESEELVKKTNSLVELQQIVDKLKEERDELLKKANQLPELQEKIDKLSKERDQLNKKMDNLVEEHRYALTKQEEEINSTWKNSVAEQLKDLKSKHDQMISENNKSWEEKLELQKLTLDLKYKKLKDKFLQLHLTIKESLAGASDSDVEESSVPNQEQDAASAN